MFIHSSTGIGKVSPWSFNKSIVPALFGVLVLLLNASQLNAANITGIDFNAQPGGKVEIRLDFDSAPPEPKGYTIEKPARIALDLQDVKSLLKKKKHTLDLGNTNSVVVLEAQGRTRLIVNLAQLTTYATRIDNNSLFVTVGNDGVQDYLKETKNELQASLKADSKATIKNIDFRRGENGEGKVIVELSSADVDVDARQEGSLIKLIFADTQLPSALSRRYDVADFSTPVQYIEADSADGLAQISLKPVGQYDYLAYQTDTTYVLSIKPLTIDEVEAKKKEFAYVGDKLSLNFQNIEVRAVLQLIADFTDLNLVASDTVSGKITLRLQNVPWDQALDLILKTKGLDKRQEGNVLMVAPAVEIAERERQEIETNKLINELAPLQTEFIRVKYASATAIFNLFGGSDTGEGEGEDGDSESTGSILSPRGSVIVDERTNSLLVTETAQKLEEFRRLIKLIDVPVRQVLVEARIVVATSETSEKLGVRWGGASLSNTNKDGSIITGNGTSFTDIFNGDDLNYADTMAVDLGVPDAGASSLLLGYVKNSRILSLELSAIESSGNGEIVSQPKVITGDKQQATIKSGQQVPFLESSSSGRTTVKFKDVVLQLDVTPHITPDDRVVMDLVINQDSLGGFINGEGGSQIPLIDTNELDTQVLVGNGETVVLGGVFRTEDVKSVTKTPFLGDIPYLGRLFRSNNTRQVKTETLIFITPRILADRLVN
jgi:type IV pilus assembly protein PilQ